MSAQQGIFVSVPSQEWAKEYKGYKAVICLQYTPPSTSSGGKLLVGVVLLVEKKVGRPKGRKMWELVREQHPADDGRGSSSRESLKFQQRPGRHSFCSWSKAKRPTIGCVEKAKKPLLFLRQYFHTNNPSTSKRQADDDDDQHQTIAQSGRGVNVGSNNWKDLDNTQEVEELVQTAYEVGEELKPFQTIVDQSTDWWTCFELDKAADRSAPHPPSTSVPGIALQQSTESCSLGTTGSSEQAAQDDAHGEEDSRAREGVVSQHVGLNAADVGSDYSPAGVQEGSRNKRARTCAHERREGLRSTHIEQSDSDADGDMGQTIDDTVPMNGSPSQNADLQQQNGHAHSRRPKVETEIAASGRLAPTLIPIARDSLPRPIASNYQTMTAAPCNPVDLNNEKEVQVFQGDDPSRLTLDDVRRTMRGDGAKRHDFLIHLSYEVYPHLFKDSSQDFKDCCFLAHELNQLIRLAPSDERLEHELFKNLCHLHYLLLANTPWTQSQAKETFLKSFALLGKVYNTPK